MPISPVIPIIGAAVGAIGTVASVVNQNRQAQAQRDLLEQSKELSAIQTQQRLAAIEQKRMFTEHQLKLDNMARSQEREIASMQLNLQQQAINNQIQQESLNNQANAQMIAQEQGFATGARQNQTFLQQQQLEQQQQLSQMGRDFNFLTQDAALNLQNAAQFSGQAAQLRNQLAAIENQEVGVRQQVVSQLDQLAQQFQNAGAQEREAIRQQAQAAVTLAGGSGLSLSDRAALGEVDNRIMQAAVERALQTGRTEELLKEAEAFQLGQLQRQRENITGDFQDRRLLSRAQFGQARGQLQGQTILGDVQRTLGTNLGRGQINLSAQLQQLGIDQAALTQLNLNDAATQRNLQQLGLDAAALDTLRVAQSNSARLGDAQAALNQQFGELALDANRLSVQSAGAAERAAISGQQAMIRSPGALGFLSAVAGAGADIVNSGLLSGNVQTAPTNPFYQPPQPQANFATTGPVFNTPFTPGINSVADLTGAVGTVQDPFEIK